ncbi:hypothetical protein ACMAZF_07040 [Psychrobium sp. nBUS_13]|uniref:hypothetical protein n=1 Tax=Psychrobium sp. nBUS_13 TaxID=3395319 RepID=UPI003EBD9493
MKTRKYLKKLLKENIVSKLSRAGFYCFEDTFTKTNKDAFPFGDLRRNLDGRIEIISIQIGKNGYSFRIGAGKILDSGVVKDGVNYPANQCTYAASPPYIHLCRKASANYELLEWGSDRRDWFGNYFYPKKPHKKIEKAVNEAVESLDDVIEWLDGGKIGSYIKQYYL